MDAFIETLDVYKAVGHNICTDFLKLTLKLRETKLKPVLE